MRTPHPFFLILVLFLPNEGYSQPIPGNTQFSLDGEIAGRDTGSVILWYNNDDNKSIADTGRYIKGRFHFSGTVNRACEAFLWTDLKNIDFDDPSVIRFILEPDSLYIYQKVSDRLNPVITGSKAETEKLNWDKIKMPLLDSKRHSYDTIKSLARLSKTNKDPALEYQMKLVSEKMDSIRQRIQVLDVGYIQMHPDSYVAGYLLYRQMKRLSVDSLKMFYTGLTANVRKSTLGHWVLEHVYALTNDNEFRNANPLIDDAFGQRLKNLHSVYDLALRDTAGSMIQLSTFKGKYIVIDFWASWCGPCVENIPALKQMTKEYEPDSVQFISISLDRDVNDWKQAILKHHFTGIQLSDSAGSNGLAAIYCKAVKVPTYLVADRDGRIIKYDAPQAVEPELKALLDNLLRQHSKSLASGEEK